MGRSPFLEALKAGVLLADGAVGSELYAAATSDSRASGPPFEQWNLLEQDRVQQLHLDYLNAGARVIKTNTFAANRLRLERYGLEDKVWDLNVWGVKIARNAREVAGEPAFVGGSVGPLGRALLPLGPLDPQEARQIFREQMEGLLAGGIDFFLLETMGDPREAREAVLAAREISDLPVCLQFSFSVTGETDSGARPEEVAQALGELGEARPEIVGVNCGTGPAPVLEWLQELRDHLPWEAWLSAMPNAGVPHREEGRFLFRSDPDYFASFVEPFVLAGVRLIGGCCGTTPVHTRLMAEKLRSLRKDASQRADFSRSSASRRGLGATSPSAPGVIEEDSDTEGIRVAVHAGEEPSHIPPPVHDGGFRNKLGRQFVVSVELDPPRGVRAKKYLYGARILKEAGVDAVDIGDSPMARIRMSHLAGALLVMHYTGLETIIHFTTRDRNLMAIQSDLLGAHALGIRHILALTGDPPRLGNMTSASPVYDVDSIGLLRILNGLNEGKDAAGNPIGRPTEFTRGCALTPVPDDYETEIARFREKLALQPDYVMTQPIYELEPLLRVLDDVGGCSVPILLGVMPLHSSKHAEYLHNEVPGISIPERVREALRKAGDEGMRVGMEKAFELVEEAAPYIDGIYIVPSFGKYEPVADFVRAVKAKFTATRKASTG